MSAQFLRRSAEKRRSTDVSIEEWTGGLTARHRRQLLLNQEEKELAMRPELPWHFHSMDLCANTHYPSDPSGANALPNRPFPANIGGSQRPPLRDTLPLSTQAETSNTNFPHTHTLQGFVIGSLRCSSPSANLVSFLPRMLSSRVGS